MVKRSDKGKEQILNPNSHPRFTNTIFSSLSQFINSSDLFPTHDRRIGLIVTCGYHPEHDRVMVLIEEELPSFISTSCGEYIDPDQCEEETRNSCQKIAESCRRQAQELLQHAERLEKLATKNSPIIDVSKIDKDKDHEVIFVEISKPKKTALVSPAYSPTPRSVSLDMDDI